MITIPNEIRGARYRQTYRNEKIYIIVSELNGRPVEIFAKFDQEGKDATKYLTEAGWDLCTRLISKMLQSNDKIGRAHV